MQDIVYIIRYHMVLRIKYRKNAITFDKIIN